MRRFNEKCLTRMYTDGDYDARQSILDRMDDLANLQSGQGLDVLVGISVVTSGTLRSF